MPSIELVPLVLNRRRFLRWVTALFAVSLPAVLEAKKSDAMPGLASNQRSDFTHILDQLMGTSPQMNEQGLLLDIPTVAENGALVPITLTASTSAESLYILAEGNPGPLLAEFHFHGTAVPKVSLRVKLNQTGPVTALSHNQRGWMRIDRLVKVAVGGCG
ncbi:MAG: hypothetical protein RLZZ627_1790 [Pseudomonadota bacterium]|jgi:sulfur-oxidizing protein SoxY